MAPLNGSLPCGSIFSLTPLDPTVPVFSADMPHSTYDAATDVYRDTRGCEYRQLFQDYPVLAPLYTHFEATFNAYPYVELANRYMSVAWLLCAAYALFLIVGSRVMANRAPFKLRPVLIAWSIGLSIFSTIGFLRTAPHLINTLLTHGFYHSVCMPSEPSYGHGAVGLWTMLFIYSKIPELGDTVFIVLRKNELIFLHWYHHITVLLYCWHSYMTRSSMGLYFVAMNYGVHALMYFYYGLSAAGVKGIKWAPLVTVLQISQMFVGMFVCAAVAYFHHQGLLCDITAENYIAGWVMYASYAALFIIFALEKYIWGKSSLERKAKKPAPVDDDAAAKAKKEEGAGEDPSATATSTSSTKAAAAAGLRQRK